MEVISGKSNKLIVCIYEFIGTALLIYAINLGAYGIAPNFAIAFMIFALILLGGPISGAHFNPAVTLGVYVSNRFWRQDWTFFLAITFSQLLGGLFGILLVWGSLVNY
jgi:glycerol uptake facilitator-like aquaporin